MNKSALLATVIGIAVFIGILLLPEGKTTEHDRCFMDYSEYFIFTLHNPRQVERDIRKIDYFEMSVAMKKDNKNHSFRFATMWGWDARLSYRGRIGEEAVYCFEFLDTGTRNEIMIQDRKYMNMLLTAIERMFLSIDPDVRMEIGKHKKLPQEREHGNVIFSESVCGEERYGANIIPTPVHRYDNVPQPTESFRQD